MNQATLRKKEEIKEQEEKRRVTTIIQVLDEYDRNKGFKLAQVDYDKTNNATHGISSANLYHMNFQMKYHKEIKNEEKIIFNNEPWYIKEAINEYLEFKDFYKELKTEEQLDPLMKDLKKSFEPVKKVYISLGREALSNVVERLFNEKKVSEITLGIIRGYDITPFYGK